VLVSGDGGVSGVGDHVLDATAPRDDGRRPKYRQLRDALLEMIAALPPGAPVPTERELCLRFSLSRSTVRHALRELEAGQRISRQQGKGTFVSPRKIEQPLELTSHTEEMRARGLTPASKLIDVSRVPAGRDVGTMLGLPAGAEVLRIERLRLADAEPIALEVLYLDAVRFDGISGALNDHESFYQLLKATYGVELAMADETIEAVAATENEAVLLGSSEGAPMLLFARRTFDTAGRPTEYVRSIYRGDRFRFRTRLERPPPGPEAHIPVTLRFGTEDDAEALAQIFVEAWQSEYVGVVDEKVRAGLDLGETADWLRRLLAAPETTLVATTRDQPVGFARYGDDPLDPRRGHLFALYVRPAAAGYGIGRTLLTRVLEALEAGGPRPVTLWVFENNVRARRFYASVGFAPDGATRVEPEYGATEVRLHRRPSSLGPRTTGPEDDVDGPRKRGSGGWGR
jgi:GntR family transcriptional regulator